MKPQIHSSSHDMIKVVAGCIGVIALVVIIQTGYTAWSLKNIKSFDNCMKARGSVVMESYPPRCRTADGRVFDPDPAQFPAPEVPPGGYAE